MSLLPGYIYFDILYITKL